MDPRYGRRAVAFFKRFFKWIGRGVKKVGGFIKKHWKKVALTALLAASAFFTFGAALGLTAGWASKVGLLVSKLGVSGKMAGIMSSAIVQAGQGAMLGGVTGTLTGQGFMKGAAAGAVLGAVSGGVTGAIRPVASGLPGGQPGTAAAGTGTAGNPIGSAVTPGGTLPSAPLGTLAHAVAPKASAFGSVWEKVIGSGGIGPIIQGVGAGLARGADQKAITKRDDERRDSYDLDYTPIKPMFRSPSSTILSDSFAAPA